MVSGPSRPTERIALLPPYSGLHFSGDTRHLYTHFYQLVILLAIPWRVLADHQHQHKEEGREKDCMEKGAVVYYLFVFPPGLAIGESVPHQGHVGVYPR